MNESVMQFPSYSQVAETRSLRGFLDGYVMLSSVMLMDIYGELRVVVDLRVV